MFLYGLFYLFLKLSLSLFYLVLIILVFEGLFFLGVKVKFIISLIMNLLQLEIMYKIRIACILFAAVFTFISFSGPSPILFPFFESQFVETKVAYILSFNFYIFSFDFSFIFARFLLFSKLIFQNQKIAYLMLASTPRYNYWGLIWLIGILNEY